MQSQHFGRSDMRINSTFRLLTLLFVATCLWTPTMSQEDPTWQTPGELFGSQPEGDLIGTDPDSLSYIATDVFPELQTSVRPSGPVIVGVIDSGVNPDHPQLQGLILEMRSFTSSVPRDTLGHGTAVAITATISGQNIRILSAKVTDDENVPRLGAFLEALDWVSSSGATIINVSLGFDPGNPGATKICDKIEEIERRSPGVLVVAAAGNQGMAWAPVPAGCGSRNLLSVASDEETSGQGDIVAPRPLRIDRAAYLVGQAQSTLARGEPQAAVDLLREVLSKDDDNFAAHYLIATAYFTLAQTPLAHRHAIRAVEIDGGQTSALWLKALTAANLADRETAIDALQRLLEIEEGFLLAQDLLSFLSDGQNTLPDSLEGFFNARKNEVSE